MDEKSIFQNLITAYIFFYVSATKPREGFFDIYLFIFCWKVVSILLG